MSEGKSIPGRVGYQLGSVKVLMDAGVIRPMRPDKLLKFVQTLVRWGRSPAAGTIALAARYPDETMIVDELGTLTFAEVHRRTNALAHALSDARRQRGRRRGDHVPQPPRLHRVHRRRVEARRRRALPQHRLRRPAARRGGRAREARRRSSTTRSSPGCSRTRASGASASSPGTTPRARRPDARRADRAGRPARRRPAAREGRAVILTSARPARRRAPRAATRSRSTRPCRCSRRIPLQARQTAYIAAPLFHSWGFAHFTLGLILGSTYVLRRKFDPEAVPGRRRALRAPSRSWWCR